MYYRPSSAAVYTLVLIFYSPYLFAQDGRYFEREPNENLRKSLIPSNNFPFYGRIYARRQINYKRRVSVLLWSRIIVTLLVDTGRRHREIKNTHTNRTRCNEDKLKLRHRTNTRRIGTRGRQKITRQTDTKRQRRH